MDEKPKIGPIVVLVGIFVVLGIGGILIWRNIPRSSEAPPTVIKPANPDDPRYKPNPALGLAGSGSGR